MKLAAFPQFTTKQKEQLLDFLKKVTANSELEGARPPFSMAIWKENRPVILIPGYWEDRSYDRTYYLADATTSSTGQVHINTRAHILLAVAFQLRQFAQLEEGDEDELNNMIKVLARHLMICEVSDFLVAYSDKKGFAIRGIAINEGRILIYSDEIGWTDLDGNKVEAPKDRVFYIEEESEPF